MIRLHSTIERQILGNIWLSFDCIRQSNRNHLIAFNWFGVRLVRLTSSGYVTVFQYGFRVTNHGCFKEKWQTFKICNQHTSLSAIFNLSNESREITVHSHFHSWILHCVVVFWCTTLLYFAFSLGISTRWLDEGFSRAIFTGRGLSLLYFHNQISLLKKPWC